MSKDVEYLKMQINQLNNLIVALTNRNLSYKKLHKPNCKFYSSEWTKLESTHPYVVYIKTAIKNGEELSRRKNKLNHFKNLLNNIKS